MRAQVREHFLQIQITTPPDFAGHCLGTRSGACCAFLKPDPDYIRFRPYGAIPRPFKVNRPGAAPDGRSRRLYFLLVLAVIGLGLLSRSRWIPLPPLVAKSTGDALWSLMVFLGIGFLVPRVRTRTAALAALLFSFAIECSQLYHAPWIDHWRSFRLGALILGTTFNWPDWMLA